MAVAVSRNKVFSRFNTAVILVFTFIVVISLVIASIRYVAETEVYRDRAAETLKQHANNLNDVLSRNVNTLVGIQEYADLFMRTPDETTGIMPNLAQEDDEFYLIEPPRDLINQRRLLTANITGIGKLDEFDQLIKHELTLANALTPMFVNAQHSNEEIVWIYYVSLNRFVSLYPWISRRSWRYSDHMVSQGYMETIKQQSLIGNVFWTPPVTDSAGKGLIASIASGVFRYGQFVGSLVIDLNLKQLMSSLPDINDDKHGIILINEHNTVVLHKTRDPALIEPNTLVFDVLPEPLSNLSVQAFEQLSSSAVIGQWIIQKRQLPINGWTLIEYRDYDEFVSPLINEFIFAFSWLLFGLGAFVVVTYLLTRTTFIKPVRQFILHIEHSAQGEPGKIQPPPDWGYWFKVVEDIFGQNRSLMQQLKDQNVELDKRVNEKTKALLIASEQHQRDYALLRSVMNAIPELIIFSDPDGKLIGCNSAVESYLNHNEAVMLGQVASELMPKKLGRALADISERSYHDSEANVYQQLVKTKKRTFELFSRRFSNDLDNSLGTINIFRDVTQQYKTQAALKQAKIQAENANQAKSQFLANMSHEIRTPINAIQGMMYLLDKTALNSVQRQYLSNAETASTSLLYLIDELLDLAKIESGKMPLVREDINIDVMVEKALKLNVGAAYGKNLAIRVRIADDVPQRVVSDEMRLMQVIANLLNNAVKFTHQGEVRLDVECTGQGPDNALIKFRVSDTGIGIAKDKQANLFEAFTQADESMTRQYGGSGLGLSICRQIVNLLGGEMKLKSKQGKGSEFSFVIPCRLPKEPLAEPNCPVLHLYSYDFYLPEDFAQSLDAIEWRHTYCGQPDALLPSTDKGQVLLIDGRKEQTLAALLASPNWQQQQDKFCLICLCQPMNTAIDNSVNELLEQTGKPWVIIEYPLYRLAIAQIKAAMAPCIEAAAAEIAEQFDEVPLAQQVLLDGVEVLLVEDNLVNQLVAKELLLSMNAKVTIAENGQIALALLAEKTFDIVLMDIQMPVMDGLTAAREIRKLPQFMRLPIIAMTAHGREEDRLQSAQAGMNLHVAKPISYDIMLSSIKQLLG